MQRPGNTAAIRKRSILAWLAAACWGLAGCGFSTQIPDSDPSGLEQMLVVRSLERAVAQLELDRYAGQRVHLDFFSLLKDGRYAWNYLATRLEQHGAEVVSDAEAAGLRLRVFASVMGIDNADSFFGIPAITTPFIGVTTPAVEFYKSIRNRGLTDLKVYAFDSRTGRFLSEQSPHSIGKAEYNRYTLLIFLKFTLTDLDRPVP